MRAGYAPLPPVEDSKSKKKRAATTTPKNKSSNSKNAKTSSDTDDDKSDTEDFLKVTLAEKWDETKQDPTGYYLSERLDGMRCVLKYDKLWRCVYSRLMMTLTT
jgi:DNA ligase 1